MTRVPELLIVDDEPDFAEFVRAVGAETGFRARVATTADAFRARYAERVPDVIVMDMVMPGADGIELTRWLVEAGYRGRLIIITGYNPDYAKAARALGEHAGAIAVSVLGKPVKVAELRLALGCG
ncbi:MAG: response regulator [Alphaproteobacteria bacterium]|nr:response regulator [Alphaproteobacteria bacterium]